MPVHADRKFPAALAALPPYITENWSSTSTDFADLKARFPANANISTDVFISHCHKLNSENSKFPPWKTLQGLLWRQSYQSGSVKAPLYNDVLPALQTLKSSGVRVYIYSSGSIEAQKLLFAHTNHGDITDLIDGCRYPLAMILTIDFDPAYLGVDNKFDVKGYESIIDQTGIMEWTFFSDVAKEVGAAEKAGMKGYILVREGNKPLSDKEKEEYNVLYDGIAGILDLI